MARQTIEILTDKSREIEFGKTRQWKLARNETMAWLGCDSYQNLNHPPPHALVQWPRAFFKMKMCTFEKIKKSFSTVNQFLTYSEKLIPNIQKHIP